MSCGWHWEEKILKNLYLNFSQNLISLYKLNYKQIILYQELLFKNFDCFYELPNYNQERTERKWTVIITTG